MNKTQTANSTWRKILRVAFYTLGSLLLLLVLCLFALTLPPVQQRITREVKTFLENKLQTRVELGSIGVRFPYHISLEKLLVEDQQQDTLIRVGSLVITLDMWKLLDQTIEFQQVTLEDAVVYLHQKDSIYNYDFIVRAFSNPKAASSADTTCSPWKLQVDLTQIQLRKVRFLMQDDDSASTTAANIGLLQTVLLKADLDKLDFEMGDFKLMDSDIRLIEQKPSVSSGKAPPQFAFSLQAGEISNSHFLYSTTQQYLNAQIQQSGFDKLTINSAENGLAIHAQGIVLKNSAIAYRDPETQATPGHLNAGDLDLQQLNAELPQFSFQQDTLFVEADAFSGTDKSGLKVSSLEASINVNPGGVELNRVLAQLNETQVDGDVQLLKKNKATYGYMKVNLRRLKGVVGDLIVLLPPLETQALAQLSDLNYTVSGRLEGWLENLQTEKMVFEAGTGTQAFFSGSLQHLTEPKQLEMHLAIDRLETNRADLLRYMSLSDTPMDSIVKQPLPAYLSASGTLNGNMESLQLQLNGVLGPIQTDSIFAGLNSSPLQFGIQGALTALNDPDKLGMDLTIQRLEAPKSFFAYLESDGKNFPDMLQATGTLKGTLANLQTDIQVKTLRKGVSSSMAFKGLLKNLRDPGQLGFDGNFDASLARQEIQGYIPSISQSLRLPDFVMVSGDAHGMVKDATGKVKIGFGTWGEVQLEGTLRDSTYQIKMVGQNIAVSQLSADTSLQLLKTIGFNAQIKGAGFDVWKSAQLQLSGKVDSVIWDNLILRDIALTGDLSGKRFKASIVSPDERVSVSAMVSGDFETAIPILETDISLNCVDLRAFGWASRPTHLCMEMISHSEGFSLDTLTANVRIKKLDLQYDTVHVQPGDMTFDIQLDQHRNRLQINSDWLKGELKGYFSLLDLPATIGNIFEQYFVVDRSTYVPRVSTDSVFVQLDFLNPAVLTTGLIPGLTELAPLHLEGALIGQRNYFNLRIQVPRIVYLNWDLDSMNLRSYAGDSAALFVLTTPKLKKGQQDFIENVVLNGSFVANKAHVSFKASDKEGRDRFLLALEATMNNGTQETVVKLFPRQLIDFKEWAVDPDNEISITPKGISVQQVTLSGAGQSIALEGRTNKLPGNKTGLDFALQVDRLNYNNFDIFLSDVLTNLDGWGEAHLKIKGRTDDFQVLGSLQLHETFFTPKLTNVRYGLSETPLEFTATGLTLDGLTLRDPYGKALEINGKLTTSDWTSIQANLNLHADRWQVMNSNKQQNPVYYGEVFVSLDGTIRGPLSQPELQLSLKTAKESNFTYVYDVATQSLQHEGVVFFVPPPRQYVRPEIYDAPVVTQPYTLSASIEIDSNLTINSVINPVTGDDFKGKAKGKLQLDILSNGTMTLVGRVELVRGVYNYSYQSVVQRSFNVSNGSSITWTGDVGAPELDIKARYRFKASPFPLVSTQLLDASEDETAPYRKSQTFYLQTSIVGSVVKPDVGFQFIYPEEESQGVLGTSFGNQQASLVENALNNVNQDKNQLSRQVFGVLLLRNFIGDGSFDVVSSNGNPLQSGLTNFLTTQINALADQYLTWIDIDLSTTDASSSNGTAQDQSATSYQLHLQKSFFNDRLTFKISGGTTVGSTTGEAHSALENAAVEYAVTPNGAFKITVFSEKGFELLNTSTANLRNSGTGLIFTKEFGKR